MTAPVASDRHRVVVGIGPEGAPAAVAYAAGEAIAEAWRLHLVRVIPVPPIDLPSLSGDPARAVQAAATVLDGAAECARRYVGDARAVVTTELVEGGWVVAQLAARAEQASLVVLERRHPGTLHRIVAGSAVHGLAGRAPVPVVVVPEGWEPAKRDHPVVTCAVQDTADADALVRLACVEAESRGADVVVLHTWDLGGTDFDTTVDVDMKRQWAERARRELEPTVAALRSAFPTVAVTVLVEHARAAEALLRAAAVSDLLVVGRRHHRLPWGSHLGPVARAVVDRSPCPVLVAPELRSPAAVPAGAADLATST